MNKKRKILFPILLLPLVISLSACNLKKNDSNPPEDEKPADSEPVTPASDEPMVSIATNYFTERNSIYFSYTFDLKDFEIIGDEPNINVLKMSMLFDANISTGSKVIFNNTEYPVKGYDDVDSFYQHLGLDNLEKIDVVAKGEVDVDDVSYLNISHKKYEGKDICFVSIIDSGVGTAWSSNFDLGLDDASYYDKTGEHPEWTNKDNHKGFDVTGNRIVEILKDYKNRILDKNSQQIFYIFGHSRGGALANVVGAKLVDLDFEVASYGLASPAVTTSENASNEKYNHLYSYINQQDSVTGILSPGWGFKRYGKTFSFAIADYKEQFAAYNGFEFPTYQGINISEVLQSICNGREEVYEISDEFTLFESSPLQPDEVDNYIEDKLAPLKDKYASLRNYIEIEQNSNDDDTITVVIKTCPAFIISALGKVISSANGDSSSSLLSEVIGLSGFLDCFLKKAGIKLTDLLSFNFNYFAICHAFPSYLTYINLL